MHCSLSDTKDANCSSREDLQTPKKRTIHTIANLSLNKINGQIWPICARVIQKSEQQKSKFGKYFFKVLFQDSSGRIEALAFQENVARFYKQLKVNKIYYIEDAFLKSVNQQYKNVGHDLELMFQASTKITPCTNAGDSPKSPFTPLDKLTQLYFEGENHAVDVIGLLIEVGQLENKETVRGPTHFRKLILSDKDDNRVEVALWGNHAQNFSQPASLTEPVLAIKGVSVRKYQGKIVLYSTFKTLFEFNPSVPETENLGLQHVNQAVPEPSTSTNTGNTIKRNLFSQKDKGEENDTDNVGRNKRNDHDHDSGTTKVMDEDDIEDVGNNDTTDAAAIDDDEDEITRPKSLKKRKRVVVSDDEDSSDSVDTIVYSPKIPGTSISDSDEDSSSSVALKKIRKKKKFSRIKNPVTSSLETENSEPALEDADLDEYDYGDGFIDDSDSDGRSSSENGEGGHGDDTDSGSGGDDDTGTDTDSSESSDDSDGRDRVLEQEKRKLMKEDPLFEKVYLYCYWMIMKIFGKESEEQDVLDSVHSLDNKIHSVLSLSVSMAWCEPFQRSIKKYPDFKDAGTRDSVEWAMGCLTDCEACKRKGHPWNNVIVFKGNPYNRISFKEQESADDDDGEDEDSDDSTDETKFKVGCFCYERAKLYHRLYHWVFHLHKICKQELTEKDDDPDAVMKDDYFVLEQYKKLKHAMNRIEQEYTEDGRERTNGNGTRNRRRNLNGRHFFY